MTLQELPSAFEAPRSGMAGLALRGAEVFNNNNNGDLSIFRTRGDSGLLRSFGNPVIAGAGDFTTGNRPSPEHVAGRTLNVTENGRRLQQTQYGDNAVITRDPARQVQHLDASGRPATNDNGQPLRTPRIESTLSGNVRTDFGYDNNNQVNRISISDVRNPNAVNTIERVPADTMVRGANGQPTRVGEDLWAPRNPDGSFNMQQARRMHVNGVDQEGNMHYRDLEQGNGVEMVRQRNGRIIDERTHNINQRFGRPGLPATEQEGMGNQEQMQQVMRAIQQLTELVRQLLQQNGILRNPGDQQTPGQPQQRPGQPPRPGQQPVNPGDAPPRPNQPQPQPDVQQPGGRPQQGRPQQPGQQQPRPEVPQQPRPVEQQRPNDSQPPRTETPAQAQARLQRLESGLNALAKIKGNFAAIDADGNGEISAQELQTWMDAMSRQNPNPLSQDEQRSLNGLRQALASSDNVHITNSNIDGFINSARDRLVSQTLAGAQGRELNQNESAALVRAGQGSPEARDQVLAGVLRAGGPNGELNQSQTAVIKQLIEGARSNGQNPDLSRLNETLRANNISLSISDNNSLVIQRRPPLAPQEIPLTAMPPRPTPTPIQRPGLQFRADDQRTFV